MSQVLARVVHENDVNKLEHLGYERGFEITYTPIKDAPGALYEYLVCVIFSPIQYNIVCNGKGSSPEIAMIDAAKNMLRYLLLSYFNTTRKSY